MPLTPDFTPSIAPGNSYYGLTGNFTAPDNSGHSVSGSTSPAANNTFYTLNGSDILKGFDGSDKLYSGGGRDIVEGGDGNDTVSGDAGDDYLYGDYQYEASFATGDDFIFGGSGNDYLFGAGGNDELNGGTDDDILEGGSGEDLLTGGAGTDEFRFDLTIETSTGWLDTVTDFTDGVDILHYTGVTASTTFEVFDAGSLLSSLDGTLVRADGIHWVYLKGFDDTLIDNSDFVFT